MPPSDAEIAALLPTGCARAAVLRTVQAGPLTLQLRFADRQLETMFAPAFYPGQDDHAPSWTISITAGTPGQGLPLPGFDRAEPEMRLVETQHCYALWMGRHSPCLYAVDRRTRHALCWIADRNAVRAWERSRPFLPALQAMLDGTPWIALHAAALACGERGILLAGPGRAGKTTLSLAALVAGWRFLADDYVLARTDQPALAPLFATARLRDDMLPRFPMLAAARTGVSQDFGETRHELGLHGFGTLRPGAVPLARLLFLDRSGRQEPGFGQVGRAQVLSTLAANTFVATPGARPARLRKIARLLAAAPPLRYDPGRDPDAALTALATSVA